MIITKIVFYIILLEISDGVCKKYDNYTLYRAVPQKDKQLRFFKNLSQMYKVDFWRPPGMLLKPVEFTVAPEDKHSFLRDAASRELYLTPIIDDVQSAFDKQTVKTYIRRKMESFDWSSFYKLKDIYQWLKDLSKVHPDELKLISIGKTHEDRNIMAARIVLKGSHNRSTVIVEGGIHAREWISPAFVTYFLHQILNAAHSNNTALKNIAQTYEWYFVPVLNADGYEYSHSTDRMWRKNRNGQGVDLNRNFEIAFGTVGVSKQRNAEIFCGYEPFSERESSAMANFIKPKSDRLEYYLAFHAYGQYIIIPYAHTMKHLDNYDEVNAMATEAREQIKRRYGTKYTVGTAHDTVGYMTSGVSGDWAKKSFKVPYVASFELRDNGRHGFALPPNEILPTCLETMDGILSLLSPRSQNLIKLKSSNRITNRQESTFLDKIVVIFNVLLFIIARFDYIIFYLGN